MTRTAEEIADSLSEAEHVAFLDGNFDALPRRFATFCEHPGCPIRVLNKVGLAVRSILESRNA